MEKYPLQFFKDCGSRGGNSTYEKYGSEHYRKMVAITNEKKRLKRELAAKQASSTL